MTDRDVFDICYARYVEYRAQLDGGKLGAVNPAASAKGSASAAAPRVLEYVADFDLAGITALKPHQGRLLTFLVFFCERMAYKDAVQHVRVPQGTFDYWLGVIKKKVGRELRRRKIYPPSKYFNSSSERAIEPTSQGKSKT